ncbi:hypothetical protein KAR91_55985 [Candidatus Pacearchaeota archaeon]|nr:hypothetical protein [Candidatus Pacearchaeota archaeon]
MNIRLFFAILLLGISTLSYNLPSYFINLDGIDISKVPKDFYAFYCLFIAFNLFLVATYSFYLFVLTDVKYYKTKILFCWLFLAETATFLDHVFRKYWISAAHNNIQMIVTWVIFTICFFWFLSRAMYADKSAKFYPDRTYIVKFKPANILGIFNHIANLHGHVGVYQNGKIYKFKKAKGTVIAIPIHPNRLKSMIKEGRISIREIPKNKNILSLVGKEYSLLRYNCNHLMKDAIGET